MRLTNVNSGRLSGLKCKLVCHFKLAADMVEDDIRQFVYSADGSAFLKRQLMGLGFGVKASE